MHTIMNLFSPIPHATIIYNMHFSFRNIQNYKLQKLFESRYFTGKITENIASEPGHTGLSRLGFPVK